MRLAIDKLSVVLTFAGAATLATKSQQKNVKNIFDCNFMRHAEVTSKVTYERPVLVRQGRLPRQLAVSRPRFVQLGSDGVQAGPLL